MHHEVGFVRDWGWGEGGGEWQERRARVTSHTGFQAREGAGLCSAGNGKPLLGFKLTGSLGGRNALDSQEAEARVGEGKAVRGSLLWPGGP